MMQRRSLRALQHFVESAYGSFSPLASPSSSHSLSTSHLLHRRALWSANADFGVVGCRDSSLRSLGRSFVPDHCGGEGVQAVKSVLWRQQVRHVKVNGSEVKQGNVIERKGRLYQLVNAMQVECDGPINVLKTQHTQQGRGGATIQVELRDVQSGLKSSERLRTSESIERVYVDEKTYTFLYAEGPSVVLMEPKNFEQLELRKELLGTGAVYLCVSGEWWQLVNAMHDVGDGLILCKRLLQDGMEVMVQQYDGQPFSATVPAKVTCTVTEAEPFFKGQSATPTYKRIVLENGQQILAPSFITAGDRVVIDTTDNSYVTRAK